jgi:hypothetical protein
MLSLHPSLTIYLRDNSDIPCETEPRVVSAGSQGNRAMATDSTIQPYGHYDFDSYPIIGHIVVCICFSGCPRFRIVGGKEHSQLHYTLIFHSENHSSEL